MFAATVAGNVVALAGNAPATSEAVGASCTDCAELADVYQETTRCDALAPTVRTMLELVAGAWAPATVTEPMPIAAAAASTATPAPTTGRRRARCFELRVLIGGNSR